MCPSLEGKAVAHVGKVRGDSSTVCVVLRENRGDSPMAAGEDHVMGGRVRCMSVTRN